MSLIALLAARGHTFDALPSWEREELQDLVLQEYLVRLDAAQSARVERAARAAAVVKEKAEQEAARIGAGGRRRYVTPRRPVGNRSYPNPNIRWVAR